MSADGGITDLILETFRLNGALLGSGDALVRDLGLTSARWQVLGAVALAPTPLPVAHLARNMGLTRQNVQRIADEMAAAGFLAFAPNPHHARAKLVLLTARGRSACDAAAARQAPWATALAEGLPTETVAAATALLRILRHRLEAGDEATPADGP